MNLRSNTYQFIIATALLLVVGVGCGETDLPVEPTQPATPQVINKMPDEPTLVDRAHDFCIGQGHAIGVQKKEDTGALKAYCVFPDNTACDVLAFMYGACTQTSGALAFGGDIDELLQDIRTCDATSPPVCGTDGRNYVHVCAANLQQIPVAHEGLCDENELTIVDPETPTDPTDPTVPTQSPAPVVTKNDVEPTKSESTTQLTPTVGELPDWLGLAIDLAQSQPKTQPATFIEQCEPKKKTEVYYQQHGGDSSFSILYDDDGKTLCYPNNDINDNCPEYFDKNNRGSYCTLIWTDPR